MKGQMKKAIAAKMLEKLGGIDSSNIESVTIQLVLSGSPMSTKKKKMMSESEDMQENEDEGVDSEDDESEDEY